MIGVRTIFWRLTLGLSVSWLFDHSFSRPSPNLSPSAPPRILQTWKLVWSDEFNAADNSPIDATRWTAQVGGNGWGNQELEYYTNRIDNAYQSQGSLVIKAIKERYTGADKVTRDYTSARLTTKNKFTAKYGRFEARIRIPYGQGLWPAFWMLGDNIDSTVWPTCGEIDIMENIGREPAIIHGTIHGPGYSGTKARAPLTRWQIRNASPTLFTFSRSNGNQA